MNQSTAARTPLSESYALAHLLAMAPLTFQAARIARDKGVFKALHEAKRPLGKDEVAAKCGLSYYAVRVLLEGCHGLGLVAEADGLYTLTTAGWMTEYDELVRVNMDFAHDVCYEGAFKLDASLAESRPAGLEVFGKWPTIYEGLLSLPEKVRQSWLAFDHCYSDGVFDKALASVFHRPLKRLLDVGGNTGKFALTVLKAQPQATVCILDHPAQTKAAKANAQAAGVGDRLETQAMDLLDHSKPFPTGFDAVWMSQFLDCFGETDIVQLLKRGRGALNADGELFILETFVDRQPNPVAQASIQATSIYFACMANGNSRMYRQSEFLPLIKEAGLKVDREVQFNFHTLLICKKS